MNMHNIYVCLHTCKRVNPTTTTASVWDGGDMHLLHVYEYI